MHNTVTLANFNSSVEKFYKMRILFLRKNKQFFRQINDFAKEVTKELISRNFLSVIAFYCTFPHCAFATDTYCHFFVKLHTILIF